MQLARLSQRTSPFVKTPDGPAADLILALATRPVDADDAAAVVHAPGFPEAVLGLLELPVVYDMAGCSVDLMFERV